MARFRASTPGWTAGRTAAGSPIWTAQGTWVNGQRTRETRLSDGDEMKLGGFTLRFEADGRDRATAQCDEVTIQAGIEPNLDEPADMEATMATQSVEHSLSDTSVPRVVVYGSGVAFEAPIVGNRATIGRGQESTIVVDDRMISRRHAVLERDGNRVLLRDLDSANGTWVRQHRVKQCWLTHGESFRIGSTWFIYKAPFNAPDLARIEAGSQETGGLHKAGKRPVVIVPGIMGSELYRDDEMIWPNIVTLFRRPQVLGLPDQGLRAGQIARQVVIVPNIIKLEAYSHLVDFLVESLGYELHRDLMPFAYDWRQDNRESARRLARRSTTGSGAVLGEQAKVTIVAHSMGCLVTRYFVECLGGAEKVDRLIFMGGPHGGSASIVQSILSGPQLLPLGLGNRGLHQALVTFPSAYQLVPKGLAAEDADGKAVSLLEHDDWVDPRYRSLLRGAAEFHRELGDRCSVPAVCIFGYGIRTPTKIIVDSQGAQGWEKVRFIMQPTGDCKVAQESAILAGAEIHPVNQYHGALWTDNDVKMRLTLELIR